jgi:hypothetical protein
LEEIYLIFHSPEAHVEEILHPEALYGLPGASGQQKRCWYEKSAEGLIVQHRSGQCIAVPVALSIQNKLATFSP